MAAPDPELIRLTLAGDRDAFGVLVDRYGHTVCGLVSEVVRQKGDVEDIVQECFMRAYRSLGNFRHDAQFSTWLFRIAHNLAITRSQQQVRSANTFVCSEEDVLESYEVDELLPDEILEARDLEERLMEHIDALPDHFRETLVLYYYEGQSYRDIAAILGKPMNTVKAHLRRAKAQLKKLLLAEYQPEEWRVS